MQIAKDTVVSLTYELQAAAGEVIEKASEPVSYLHGGHHGIFRRVEEALEGKRAGYTCRVELEPDDAFGRYEAALVRVEPRRLFPAGVKVGMQFDGAGEESGESRIYTVTKVTDDDVTVDGNHPLAGKALLFSCVVTAVRSASREELAHGHVHGPGDHHH